MFTQRCTRLFGLAIITSIISPLYALAQFNIPLSSISLGRRLPAPKAFDYFNGSSDGTSIENRYLLSHLSMKVYNTSGVSDAAFEQHLKVLYGNHGVQDVQLFHDSSTGADGAIFVTNDAVIVAFRGTATDPDGSMADQFADVDNRVKLVKVNNQEIGIHQGFWDASSSVYNEIWTRVVSEMVQGRKLWLTGHSLGGAMASVTAFRFQYISGIPVQGVMTFGAPRVGNAAFYKMAERSASGARPLTQSTQRFVLDGDPGPTFWNNGWDYKKRKHAYFHFGITHTIFEKGSSYEFHYNSGELTMAWIPPNELYFRLSTGIHMDYELALRQETGMLLLASDEDDILVALFALPLY